MPRFQGHHEERARVQRRGEGTPEDTNPTGEQLRARGKGAAPREAARELSKDLGRGSRHWAAGTGGRATAETTGCS